MVKQKSPKRTQKNRQGFHSVERTSSVRTGGFKYISGEVNIAGRDLIKKTEIIYQRALTAAEEAKKARSIETGLLAQGIGKYARGLKDRIADKSDSSTLYRGLLEYRLADAQKFFGRDEANKQIAEMLNQSAFSVLHAESGAGKTSLLQAGVMPAILASGHLPVYLRPYDKNPEDIIKSILLPDSEFASGLMKEPLADFLRRVTTILGAKTALVLIFDQFEEFFTRAPEQDRKSFIDEFSKCVNNSSLNVRWLFCLRKEYFSDLTAFRQGGISDPFENVYQLKPLSRAEAEEAIAKPARLKKIGFEKGLIPELLNDLGREKILPPHIQLVCSALVENLYGKQTTFTRGDYVKLGKAQGILKDHLDRVLTEKVPKNRIALCQQVLEGLVTSTQQRVLKTEQELFTALGNYPEAQVRDAISLLATNRLLRGEDTDKGPAYELAHDILLDEIKLNPEIVKRKEAEELLEQGVRNWNKRGEVLLTSKSLKSILNQTENLSLNLEWKELLLITALEHRTNTQKITATFTPQERKQLVAKWSAKLDDESLVSKTAHSVLWALRGEVPSILKNRITLWKFRSLIPQLITATVVILLIVFVATQLPENIAIWTGFSTGWKRIESFNTTCLNGEVNPRKIFVALDPADTRRIVAAGEGTNTICITNDSAYSWETMSLPTTITQLTSISTNNERIYISSKTKAYFKSTNDNEWQSVSIPTGYEDKEILSLTSNIADPLEVYLALKPSYLFISLDGGKTWKPVKTAGIQGEMTAIAGNKNYIIVTTNMGYWHKSKQDITWTQFKSSLTQNLPIAYSISMFNPEEPFFLLITPEGDVWSVYLGDTNGPFPEEGVWLDNTYHISALYTSWYASTAQGLFCNESWDIFDGEWWRWRFNYHLPCN